ncbi:hypothetical protein [Thalassospira sp.]|uniref:hypothetical protein n=1 Tax=Thalassospira sp. TaxID=1912094 RepID=UPI0027323B86|nr:hypothetical protein [Thalassospira sp.]MDP2697993.1 hypothetical protein [Thalassospira sp.]
MTFEKLRNCLVSKHRNLLFWVLACALFLSGANAGMRQGNLIQFNGADTPLHGIHHNAGMQLALLPGDAARIISNPTRLIPDPATGSLADTSDPVISPADLVLRPALRPVAAELAVSSAPHTAVHRPFSQRAPPTRM